MNKNLNDPHQGQLAKVETALRELAIPDGPSEDVMSRTLAAVIDEAGGASPGSVATQSQQKSRSWKGIAGITTLVAATILVVAGVAMFSPQETLAFEDLTKPFREAKTLVYDQVMVPAGASEAPEVKTRIYFKEPGLSRRELGGGSWMVHDIHQNTMLMVFANTKTATVTKTGKIPQKSLNSMETMAPTRWLKSASAEGEQVDSKMIEGVLAPGFRAQFGAVTMTLWGHPKTKRPLLIEMPLTVGETSYVLKMKNFQFDLPLEDSLFSIEPPEGFRVERQEMPEIDYSLVSKLKPEEHVVRLLKYYSGLFDGAFPKMIDDPALSSALTSKLAEDGELSPEERNELFSMSPSMGTVWTYRQSLKGFGYAAGVKLGESERLVFWYRPEGSETYRAVFGDLRVENVPAERIPETAN